MRELGERMSALESQRDDVERMRARPAAQHPEPAGAAGAGGRRGRERRGARVGRGAEFDFRAAAALGAGRALGILDLPRGTKIAGSGFPLYIGWARGWSVR
jgi:seryl-tRNA synthetase